MKKPAKTYHRKLSPHELKENYILITKNALPIFPPLGKLFEILIDDKRFDVTVKAVPCTCMGPDKPHEHYRIDSTTFRDYLPTKGWTPIVIRKISDLLFQVELEK